MSWNDNNNPGPWGKPSKGGGYGDKPPPPKGGPDLDDLLRKGQEHFNRHFSGPHGAPKLAIGLVVVMVFFWLISGFYQVQTGEQGVVVRFGLFNRMVGAGLRYHLPEPFETVTVVNTQLIRKESFGIHGSGRDTLQPDSDADSLMLTGDENIIDITFDVQWSIKDSRAFLFNVHNPVTTVRNVAESAMREIIGQTPFTIAQTAGKSKIEQETKDLIQKTLDSYKAGIRIMTVNLLESSAPGPVVEAVRDVQAARADEERSRNVAEAYRNDIIPKARGQAELMIQDSQAYKQEVVARAKGDTARFTAVYEQYARAPDVTKKRLYLETMEKLYTDMNKIILDNKNGAVPYLPLPGLKAPVREESK